MFVERKEYNNVITVKLVFPTGCNANCVFCYNQDKVFCKEETSTFVENFIDSFDELYNKINGLNPISLDITGGEPTLNVSLFKDVMLKLKEYNIQSKVCRVTLTTNGFHLKECAAAMDGVINYVNISVHDFSADRRVKIFKTSTIPSNYREIIEELNKYGITCSASAVISQEIEDFKKWRNEFIKWAKDCGFIAVRFRCDVFWNNTEKFDKYLLDAVNDSQFQVLVHEKTTDSHWCRLRMEDKFRVFFLHGVLDTSLKTKGIEYIIDTDGKCYCDYYRNTPLEKYEYTIGKIYDWVDLDKNL